MFKLEQAIADWRQKMLAAGIETPVPLEELELHLREEIERQMRGGLDKQKAFEIAVRCIGEARPLQEQFRRSGTLRQSRNQFYDWSLAAFILYIGAWIPLDQWSGGPITSSWGKLERFLTLASHHMQHPPTSVSPWLKLINFTFAAAMIATLVARRYQPKYGPRLSQLLNWSLLLALPWGPLIGSYGLWCGEMEKPASGLESLLGKFFALATTSITDQSNTLTKRGFAAVLQLMRATVLFFYGLSAVFEFYMVLDVLLSSDHLNLDLAYLGTILIVNAWFIWFVWNLFRGQKPQPKSVPAHV